MRTNSSAEQADAIPTLKFKYASGSHTTHSVGTLEKIIDMFLDIIYDVNT